MLESILSPQQYIHQCGVYDLIGSFKPMTINVNIVGHKKNPKTTKTHIQRIQNRKEHMAIRGKLDWIWGLVGVEG